MKISTREMIPSDIEKVVDYFINADASFLKGMGADKKKFPARDIWMELIQSELNKPNPEKEFYYIIWLINDEPVGHSNINKIHYGDHATMHLHLWNTQRRRKGLGISFLKNTLPYYFKNFHLQTVICEPYAENPAPYRVLQKLGFIQTQTYTTTPGWINFKQKVHRHELPKEVFEKSNPIE